MVSVRGGRSSPFPRPTMMSPPRPALSQFEFVALFSLVTALTAASIDTMLPALGVIGEALNVVNPNTTQLVVSMFILGMVFGELAFGPLSDAYGRKWGIMVGLAVYAVGTVIAATAVSMDMLIIGRIIQGIGAAGPKVASRALIRDLYQGNAMARIVSLIYMVFILVPMVGPALGQLIMALAGWRPIFVAFLIFAVIIALWLGVRQPETLMPDKRLPLAFGTIFRNAWLILKHPVVMAYILATGLIFGGILVYLSTSQAIFADIYDAGDKFAFYFAVLSIGIGIASFLNSKLVMRFGMYRLTVFGMCGLIANALLLLVIGLAYDGAPPLAAFLVLVFILLFFFGILFGNLNALAMEVLGRVAGIGASLVGAVSGLIAVAMSFIIGRFYDGTVLPLAAAFLIGGVLGLGLTLVARRSKAGAV